MTFRQLTWADPNPGALIAYELGLPVLVVGADGTQRITRTPGEYLAATGRNPS